MSKELARRYRQFINGVQLRPNHLDEVQAMELGDKARFMYHTIGVFDRRYETAPSIAMQMLAISRNKLIAFLADAYKYELRVNVTEGIRLLNDIEDFAEKHWVREAAQEKV